MARGYERDLRGEGRLIRDGIIVCILNGGGGDDRRGGCGGFEGRDGDEREGWIVCILRGGWR